MTQRSVSNARRKPKDKASSSLRPVQHDAALPRLPDEANHLVLQATLDNMDQGLLMVAADGTIPVWNARALELLELPLDVMRSRPRFADVLRYQFDRGDFERTDAATRHWFKSTDVELTRHWYERETCGGRVLEVRSVPAPNGAMVRTYTDITERKRAEMAREAAEREYRSLFENSVAGIYRARPDGTKVRVNPELVRICGYASEPDMLAAETPGHDWYVDPARGEEFMRRLRQDRRVTDFVSEVYRGRTGERIWISENAWLVSECTDDGCFYEGAVVDTTERKLAEAKVEHLAKHDGLTGLPNRTYFIDHLADCLETASRHGAYPAVLCLDLDNFKAVNDTLGHLVGDGLLQAVAERIRDAVAGGDMVARLGGDEFAIVLSTEPDEASALAARLLRRIREPLFVHGHRLTVGVSIGLAMSGAGNDDPDRLMKSADLALYRAKSAGRNTFRAYEAQMDAMLDARRRMELDLHRALVRREFELHYQPLFCTPTRRVTGFEALVRWRHPERGLIFPSDFITLAEDTGLIVPLGNWVLGQACKDAAAWPAPVRVSVNVSAIQFRTSDVAEDVAAALAPSGLDPDRLVLEITETTLMEESEKVADTLQNLRRLGIRIALDDFGTGYSSLSYLRRLPLDKIKIDRSFTRDLVQDERARAIVRSVVSMGADLGMTTVAEGVETEEQAELLREIGCGELQGYLLGRPQPVATLPEFLARSKGGLSKAA